MPTRKVRPCLAISSAVAGSSSTESAAALSMITKEKHPMRVLFFRDHEISGLRPAAAPIVGRGRGPFRAPPGIGEDDAATLAVQRLQEQMRAA
jgi:hypothetical protein